MFNPRQRRSTPVDTIYNTVNLPINAKISTVADFSVKDFSPLPSIKVATPLPSKNGRVAPPLPCKNAKVARSLPSKNAPHPAAWPTDPSIIQQVALKPDQLDQTLDQLDKIAHLGLVWPLALRHIAPPTWE